MIKMCANCAYGIGYVVGNPCDKCDDTSEQQPKFIVEDELISKSEVYIKITPLIKDYCSDQVVDGIKGYINVR